MKYSTTVSAYILGLSTFLLGPATANTPDLCTDDIQNLKRIQPSECDPTGRVGPDIKVGSTIYNNDEHHMVIGSPEMSSSGRIRRNLKKGKKKKGKKGESSSILVYLPGKNLIV